MCLLKGSSATRGARIEYAGRDFMLQRFASMQWFGLSFMSFAFLLRWRCIRPQDLTCLFLVVFDMWRIRSVTG